jgi:hypothetical protein
MTRVRTAFISGTLLALCSTSLFAQRATESNNAPVSQQVAIDAHAAGKPFPHYWEQMFGSGRANLSLRESYRDDLRATKKITGFQYVRFHAIFHDENGVYSEDAQGNPVYNWSYVDQIYDGLLANGVRPFVHAQGHGFAIGLSRLLVQADHLAAGELRQVGCADSSICTTSDRPLRHR